jgi:small subunit ribosomal protein S21
MSNHFKMTFENKRGVSVEVRNGNMDGAIRTLSRKMKQEGIIKEVRRRAYYEKPSVTRRRKMAEAVARWKKQQSKMDF